MQSRAHRQIDGTRGFSLIELVVVVIIIGIIAAIALPRFMNLARDARVAAVNYGVGAVSSAASLAFMKCNLTPTCDSSSQFSPVTGPGGVTGLLYYGYPIGFSNLPNGYGIKDWVQMDGFTAVEDAGGSFFTDFQMNGAPDPSTCKVHYFVRPSANAPPPVVSTTTTGC